MSTHHLFVEELPDLTVEARRGLRRGMEKSAVALVTYRSGKYIPQACREGSSRRSGTPVGHQIAQLQLSCTSPAPPPFRSAISEKRTYDELRRGDFEGVAVDGEGPSSAALIQSIVHRISELPSSHPPLRLLALRRRRTHVPKPGRRMHSSLVERVVAAIPVPV